MKPARPSRNNGAATFQPPLPVGSLIAAARFRRPMRRHVACSGCRYRARAPLAGERRAGAPGYPPRRLGLNHIAAIMALSVYALTNFLATSLASHGPTDPVSSTAGGDDDS